MANLGTKWFDEWRELYDLNEEQLSVLLERHPEQHSMIKRAQERKEFLILTLKKRENRW